MSTSFRKETKGASFGMRRPSSSHSHQAEEKAKTSRQNLSFGGSLGAPQAQDIKAMGKVISSVRLRGRSSSMTAGKEKKHVF
jgi:hypothetical protein